MTEEFRGSDEYGDGGTYRSTDGERQFFRLADFMF